MRLHEGLMPALRCRVMWRVHGFVMGKEDDAPILSIPPDGLLKTEGERSGERSSDILVPLFGLLCAAARTVPARLIQTFGHGRVAEKC